MDNGTGALAGIRVVDLSRVLSGPYCTQMLGDYGADIIKVESPQGDETRRWGPPFDDDLSAYFSGANRNKRSIVVDIAEADGREIILRLLADADVLVHNFKTGAMEKWGLGYDAVLGGRFPKLIMCHITGFGPDGPLGGFPGYDAVVQAMTGLMSINGDANDGPMRIGIPIVDIGSELIACSAILAALVERSRSGVGQPIEVPLYDSALGILHPHAANALVSNKVPGQTGNAHPNISPYDMYHTRTLPIFLAVGNNGQFAKLCDVLDLRDAAADPRYADNASRVANRKALTELLSDRFAMTDGEELEPCLLSAGVPAGVVRDVSEALAHPHTTHRGVVVSKGRYRGIGIAARLTRTPGSVRRAPPKFGANSAEILRENGYTECAIQSLLTGGVVRQGKA